MYDYRRGGSAFGAFLLGGLVGAALGLLFAPRPGRETREIIAAKAEDYWGEGVGLYNTGKERAVEIYSTGKERVAESTDQLRTKIDEARGRLQEQVARSAETAAVKVAEAVPAVTSAVEKAASATKGGIETAGAKAKTTLEAVSKRAKGSDEDDLDAPATAPAPVTAMGETPAIPEV